MPNINWKVRFTRKNIMFLFRFFAALFLPILAYLGLNYESLTTWPMVWDVIVRFISNPYLIGLTIFNAVNVIPDPVVKGLSDSSSALRYATPKESSTSAKKGKGRS